MLFSKSGYERFIKEWRESFALFSKSNGERIAEQWQNSHAAASAKAEPAEKLAALTQTAAAIDKEYFEMQAEAKRREGVKGMALLLGAALFLMPVFAAGIGATLMWLTGNGIAVACGGICGSGIGIFTGKHVAEKISNHLDKTDRIAPRTRQVMDRLLFERDEILPVIESERETLSRNMSALQAAYAAQQIEQAAQQALAKKTFTEAAARAAYQPQVVEMMPRLQLKTSRRRTAP